MTSASPARPTERSVLVWMCVMIAVNQLGFGSVIPVLPLYARTFEVSQSAIGATIAIYGLARFLVAMPAGQIADRFGRRQALALGGLLSALGNVWCALSASYPEFLAARFLAGAGGGLVVTTGIIILADITTPARRGRIMSIYQGTFMFAVGIGPLPGGVLADRFGLAAPFGCYGVAALIVGLLAWFAVPETRDLHEGAGTGATRARVPLAAQIKLLGGQIGFLLVSTIGFMNAVARTGGVFNIVPVLGRLHVGLTPEQIGLALAIGSVMGLLVTYPTGVLVDRFGRKAVIVPATLVSGTALVLYCLAPSYPWFIAASIAWGIASSMGGTAPAAYAADSAAEGMNAAAISTFRMLSDMGYVIGPIALGMIMDGFGPIVALGGTAVLVVAVGALFARLAPETYRPRAVSSG